MQPDRLRLGRIVRRAEFERVLARRPSCRSAHFAAHHLAAVPLPRKSSAGAIQSNNLSTDASPSCLQPVDESLPTGLWLGYVLPKRHARRAVTRNMIKRAIAASVKSFAPRLPAGLWVVRLRAAFDRGRYPSACSTAIRKAVDQDLRQLLLACIATAGRVRAREVAP